MTLNLELDPADHLTAAALGEPGARAFYLQARNEHVNVSMLLEKQQVALLAVHIDELLERVGLPDDAVTPNPDSLNLEEPIVAEFRIGRIGIGYDDDRDLVLLQCDEFVPEDAEEDETPVEDVERGTVRIWGTRGQMFAVARRAEREVAGGRPVCPMCGEPMDPAGHVCPRSNGHREVTSLG